VKWGIDHCAAKSVAFHYISPILMRRMHAILYHRCGAPPTSPHEAAALKAQEKADRIAAEQKVRDHAAAVEQQGNDALQKQDEKKSEKKSVVLARNELDNNPESGLGGSEKAPHLYPHFPPMPPHIMAEDLFGEEIITNTLSYDKPTIAGVVAILQRFLRKLHQMLVENRDALTPDEVIAKYFFLVKEYLAPLDAAYRDRPMFPIREDGSIFMSLGAYRDHLLGETLRQAYKTAAHPDKLFVGAVVQNCFGIGVQCRTGVEVKGTDRLGNPITEISDRPPDVNGIEEFCADPDYAKYCDNGQIRVLYVNETESNGPTTARYFASKLWGGETYYMQSDAHLRFAQDWDRLYHEEVLGAKSYPKAILTSYPPGFSDGDPPYKGGSKGTRLCSCEFSTNPVEHSIIRINTGNNCNGEEEAPTQIAFIAAGFFFTRAEFLTEVPFDPYLPWCFMGEEIALSLRAWTHGWGIYAPRKNLIAHQYRPGRMGLPKFWENTGRVFGRPGPGFNTEVSLR
jgi:[Skp1-protein]-hydroxyproline N-acetylglucosaminyltransferase